MRDKNQRNRILPLLLGTVFLALILWVISLAFTPFEVSGESMEPNFKSGETLRINQLAYIFRKPERGDLVVFVKTDEGEEGARYLKRIVGLPGETVTVKDGAIFIKNSFSSNSDELDEPYLEKNIKTLGNQEKTLGQDEYFVLGDNRNPNASIDSRIWGPIKFKDIVGKTRQ